MITGAISALPTPIQNYYPSTYITGGSRPGSTQGLADAVGRTTQGINARIDNLLSSPSISGLLSAVNGFFSGDLTVAGDLTVSGSQNLSGALGASYFTASDASATSTFTLLAATRSDLGTVIGGTWQGSPIGDAYITKTGDWTGTLSGHNGAYYLDARNLANFYTPFASALAATTSLPNLTTLAGLTNIGTSTATTTFVGGIQGGNAAFTSNVTIGTTVPLPGNAPAGSVAATKYYGDGASLTGLPGGGDATRAGDQTFTGKNTWTDTQTYNVPPVFTGIASKNYILGNGDWYTNAVPYVRPTTTNGDGILDVLANGTGSAWIDVGTDYPAQSPNGQFLMIGLIPNQYGVLAVKGLGARAGLPLIIQPTTLSFGAVTGVIGFNTAAPTEQYHFKFDQNTKTALVVENSDGGNAAYAGIDARNGTTVNDYLRMRLLGTGYTTNGGYTQNSGVLETGSSIAGGLSLITRHASGPIRFYTAGFATGNERMRITQTGNVGIATATPWGLLSVNANALTAGTPQFVVGSSTATNFIVANNGNVGIGTTTPTLGPLTMNSGAYVTTGGVWTNASDRNSKENFVTMTPTDILAKINALPITEWNYKAEDPTVKHIGPVAQEFYALFGLGGPAGNTSVSTIDPAGVALLGIQALSQRVAELSSSTPRVTFIDKSSLIDTLGYFAGQVVDGVVHFGQVVVDKITATLGIFENIQVKHTIQINDEDTGAPVCVRVKSGQIVTTPGACTDSAPTAGTTGSAGTTDSNSLQEEQGSGSTPASDQPTASITSGSGNAAAAAPGSPDTTSSTPPADPATPPAAESAVLPTPPANATAAADSAVTGASETPTSPEVPVSGQ